MRVVVAVAALSLALAADAFACSCLRVDLIRDLPRADGAFIGTVLERRVERQTAIYLFRVEQVYKGDIENRVEVVSAANGAACGLELQVDQRMGLLLTREGGKVAVEPLLPGRSVRVPCAHRHR